MYIAWASFRNDAYCTHQNEYTVRTNSTIVFKFSEYSYSNLSSRTEVIDMCTRLDKTIYSSMKIQISWLIIL